MRIVFALLFAAGWSCFAQDLKVGDTAPQLTIERWMRGEPVMQFEKGNVYVVEFWATWCGPCIKMMPHLMELQKNHADQGLRVIGVASKEDTSDRAKAEDMIEKFLNEKFPDMNYAIAFEHGGVMNKSWFEASLGRGIPHSVVVDREGKIAFIGHPAQLDNILPKILDGTLNMDEAKAADQARVARDKPMIENRKILRPILAGREEAKKAQDWMRAVQLTEAALAVTPDDLQLRFELADLILHKVRDFSRGFRVLNETAQEAAKTGTTYFLAMGVKLLYDRDQDFSYLPEKERKEIARDLSEKYLTLPANGGNELGFLLYHPIALFFNEAGETERAQKLLEAAFEAFERLDDAQAKKAFGPKFMLPMAETLANLKQEKVCFGAYCVMPAKKLDGETRAGGETSGSEQKSDKTCERDVTN